MINIFNKCNHEFKIIKEDYVVRYLDIPANFKKVKYKCIKCGKEMTKKYW